MSPQLSRRLAAAAIAVTTAAACSTDAPLTAPVPRAPTAARPNVSASALVVTSLADDGSAGTLRQAIADADPGSTITFDPALAGGTIVLAQPTGLNVGKELVIEGPTPQGIVIDGDDKVTVIGNVLGAKLVLRNLTITRGSGGLAGGIQGAGPLELENVRVVHNTAAQSGGGGIRTQFPIRIVRSTIADNTTTSGNGGGIVLETNLASLVMLESTVADNSTTGTGLGGGLYSEQATMQIERSTFSGNVAKIGGGGIYTGGTAIIRNSTFSGNEAGFLGGGIFYLDGQLQLAHVTMAYNKAGVAGGGPAILDQSPMGTAGVTSSIFAFNTSGTVQVQGESCGSTGAPIFVGVNYVDDTSCGPASASLTIGGSGIGALADNGGPTKTHAILRTSDVIDRILGSCAVAEDQVGLARPQGPGCEPGAVEFTNYVVPSMTIDANGVVDVKTGRALVGGSIACDVAGDVTLRVTVRQTQRARRVATVVQGSLDQSVSCTTSPQRWTASVAPSTGAFVNSTAEVKVETVSGPRAFRPAQALAPGVSLTWSRK